MPYVDEFRIGQIAGRHLLPTIDKYSIGDRIHIKRLNRSYPPALIEIIFAVVNSAACGRSNCRTYDEKLPYRSHSFSPFTDQGSGLALTLYVSWTPDSTERGPHWRFASQGLIGGDFLATQPFSKLNKDIDDRSRVVVMPQAR
jgi:hypothetical protein